MFSARHSVLRKGGSYAVFRTISVCRIFSNSKHGILWRGQNGINSDSLLHQIVRSYASKPTLKINWVRPTKIESIKPEKSGDLEKVSPPSFQYLKEIMDSEEFKTADDLVKRVFSLEFNPRKFSMYIAKDDMVDRVKRHPQDFGSSECRIAEMTARIRNLQQVMEEFPKNKVIKVYLKETIERRKKLLKRIRKWDYKRFEWLLEKLNLVYKSPPSEFHWIARKDSTRKLTTKYCEDLREQRLAAFKASLEAQKVDFLREKLQKLQWIRKEEKECNVEPTVTEADIEKVSLQLKEIEISKENDTRNPVKT